MKNQKRKLKNRLKHFFICNVVGHRNPFYKGEPGQKASCTKCGKRITLVEKWYDHYDSKTGESYESYERFFEER